MIRQKTLTKDKEEQKENNNYKKLASCPYCQGRLIKKGLRKKKLEIIQVYFCKNCNKKITPLITKNKTYPLKIIIDSLTLYNKLNTLNETSKIITEMHGITITPPTILKWLKEYKEYIPFLRMRDFASKNYERKDLIQESKLFHQQIYNFNFLQWVRRQMTTLTDGTYTLRC